MCQVSPHYVHDDELKKHLLLITLKTVLYVILPLSVNVGNCNVQHMGAKNLGRHNLRKNVYVLIDDIKLPDALNFGLSGILIVSNSLEIKQ